MGVQREIAKAGGIPVLMDLLQSGNAAAKEAASWALSNMACNNENKVQIFPYIHGCLSPKMCFVF